MIAPENSEMKLGISRISSPTLHTAKSQPSVHRLAAAYRSNSPPDGVFARNEDISVGSRTFWKLEKV